MIKIGKYKFNDKEQAESKIIGLGVYEDEDGDIYPNHDHTVVKLGYEVLEDESFGEKYLVDVLWKDLEEDEDGVIDHPYGWKSYSVDVEENGLHSFLGLDYQSLKI